jgi:hypothetical protein
MDRKDKIKTRLQKKLKEKTTTEERKEEEKPTEKKEEKKQSFDSLKKFQAISDFISDIAGIYGESLLELDAYNKLLSATTLKNKSAIENHIKIFTSYCKDNEKTIITQNENDIKNIIYSDALFIDMKTIFKMAEKDNKTVIWNHLLTLLYMTNPSVELKAMLKKQQAVKKDMNDNESQFLENMIDKLQNNVSEEQMNNPMSAMMGLLSSGVLTDLMGQAQSQSQSGNLNIKKLLGSVTKMVESLSDGDDDINDLNEKLKNVKV